MFKILFLINLILTFSNFTLSQSYPNNEIFFDPFLDIYSQNYLSVKAAGKGYTGIAGNNDLSGTILNPASFEQKNKFQIYGEYMYKSEEPFFRYSSDEFYEQYNPTMLAGVSYKINKDLTAGALYENGNNFNLSFDITNELGERTGKATYSMSISSISLPIVYSGADMLKFGVNLKYNFYSLKFKGSRDFDFKESFQKFVPDFGIIYKPITNLSIGATFTPQVRENIEVTFKDTNITYPDPNIFPFEIGVGVNYTFEKTPLTLSMDYHFVNTSAVRHLKDRNDFYFGLEYAFDKIVIIRIGIFTVKDFRDLDELVFVQTPNPGSYSQTFGTLGATVNIDKVNLNLSLIDSHIFSSGNITQTQINFGAGYDF